MFPANSECLIGISDGGFLLLFFRLFTGIRHLAHVLTCPRAANKSVPTLRYTRRHGPVYTGTYRVQSPGFPKIVYCVRMKLQLLIHFGDTEPVAVTAVVVVAVTMTTVVVVAVGMTVVVVVAVVMTPVVVVAVAMAMAAGH